MLLKRLKKHGYSDSDPHRSDRLVREAYKMLVKYLTEWAE